MTTNLPDRPKTGIVAALSEWLDLIQSIPGAAKAISHLVTGTAEAGGAWIDVLKASGEQRSRAIRDETEARAGFTKAIAQAATEKAVLDQAVLGRAVKTLSSTIAREQETREDIAVLALAYLADAPPAETPLESPSEDWLNVFSALAGRASSQTMKEHWAQVLKGEIRRPGAFSLTALQVMSLLDKNLADTVARVWPFVMNGSFVTTAGPFIEGQHYQDLVDLDAIGVCRTGHATTVKLDAAGAAVLNFNRMGLLLRGEPGQKFQFPAAFLTQAGRELTSIVPLEDNHAAMRAVGAAIYEAAPVKSVSIVNTSDLGGGRVAFRNEIDDCWPEGWGLAAPPPNHLGLGSGVASAGSERHAP